LLAGKTSKNLPETGFKKTYAKVFSSLVLNKLTWRLEAFSGRLESGDLIER